MQNIRFVFLLSLSFLLSVPNPLLSTPLSHSQLTSELKALAQANPNLVRYESIGKTVQGREIWCLTLTNFKQGNPAEKNGICVVANLSGTWLSGTHVVLETARSLLAQSGKVDSVTQLLDQRIFYFLPAVNADAAERFFRQPLYESAKNLTPVDDDFDALADEDGSEDLNGDGLITMMRVPDVKGEWLADSSDHRLLRKVRSGETGCFRLETEGIDSDGDELINEDPPGGVNLNQNFPHNYQQYEPGTGPFMLSEPESRAMVKFFIAHRNIVFTIIYDEFDNLLALPNTEKAEKNSQSKSPEKIAAEDEFIYRKAGELFQKNTRFKDKAEPQEQSGSLAQWLYFQYGVPVFCAKPWWPVVQPDSTTKDAGSEKSPGKSVGKKAKLEDLNWLKWADQTGSGFVA